MRKLIFLVPILAIVFLACNNQGKVAELQKTIDSLRTALTADQSSEVAAIMAADSAWSAASEKKSAEGWLSFYSPDAIMMPPGEKICTDAASREASIKNMFAIPGIELTFHSTKVEIARSGEIGYADGVYQMKSKDAKGKDYNETGKYCEIWKKQADGSWKCISDIWNADPQLAK
jgi:ketosteroid isomerase-like protein